MSWHCTRADSGCVCRAFSGTPYTIDTYDRLAQYQGRVSTSGQDRSVTNYIRWIHTAPSAQQEGCGTGEQQPLGLSPPPPGILAEFKPSTSDSGFCINCTSWQSSRCHLFCSRARNGEPRAEHGAGVEQAVSGASAPPQRSGRGATEATAQQSLRQMELQAAQVAATDSGSARGRDSRGRPQPRWAASTGVLSFSFAIVINSCCLLPWDVSSSSSVTEGRKQLPASSNLRLPPVLYSGGRCTYDLYARMIYMHI